MVFVINWISDNYIEIFGVVAGIVYVFLEIRQNIWLWPVGITTSAVYIYVFFTGKLYADMSLQVYYLIISIAGWYWWVKGAWRRAQGTGYRGQVAANKARDKYLEGAVQNDQIDEELPSLEDPLAIGSYREGVGTVDRKTSVFLIMIFILLFFTMWLVLDKITDSPVPGWDSFITALSIIATWMLARKFIEHWYLWLIVNAAAMILFLSRGLYPTTALYAVYFIMSFLGLKEWKKTLPHEGARPHPPAPSPAGRRGDV